MASARLGAWTMSLPIMRVVVRRDGVAGLDVRVPADAGAAGDAQAGDPAGRGAEVVVGVLGS